MARLFGRDYLYCSMIMMKTMYVLVSMPHLMRCSPHINRLVRLYSDVNISIAGINAASQRRCSPRLDSLWPNE